MSRFDFSKLGKWSLKDDGITQSMLSVYMSCPKKFSILTHELGEPTKLALEVGNAGHEALETYKTGQYEYGKISEAQKGQIDAYVKAILPAYLKRYGKELGKAEYIFDVPFSGTRLRGKIDRISPKKIYEHKFNARISEDDNDARLPIDFQSMFYLAVLNIENKIKPAPRTVVYDVIRYPTIKNDSSPDEIFSKVKKEAAFEPEKWFYRWETTFSGNEIENFITELSCKLLELRDRKVWYRNECACFGRYKCPYLPICTTGKITGVIKKPLFSELT